MSSQEKPNLITGKELDFFISEALKDRRVKSLFKYFDLIPSTSLIDDVQGAEYHTNGIESRVLVFQSEKNDTVITYTKHGNETKATATVQLDGESKGYQSDGDQVYKIVTTSFSDSDNELFHEWYENPFMEIDDLPNATKAESPKAGIAASCGTCKTICNAVIGTGCGLGGTASCMVVCASFAGVACPFICSAIYGLKCLGDTTILCGPSCEQLGFC